MPIKHQTQMMLDSFRHHGSDNNAAQSKTPKAPASPTVEQLLQSESSRLVDNNNNLSPTHGRDLHQEEDHFPTSPPGRKLSVIAKVKEKAKKWKHTLTRKKHGHGDDHTPSWGVSLQDYQNQVHDDDDPEYFGAPMYESETAPNTYKEHAKQNPRTDPHVLAANLKCQLPDGNSAHVLAANVKCQLPDDDYHSATEQQTPSPPKKPVNEGGNHEQASPKMYTTFTTTTTTKAPRDDDQPPSSPPPLEQTKTNTLEDEKDNTSIPEQPKSLSSNELAEEEKQDISSSNSQKKTLTETVTEKLAPAYATISEATQNITSRVQNLSLSITTKDEDGEEKEEEADADKRKWDKGVSVTEYIRNKLEPGEDERALSQVISEAISPRRTPGDKGVMEKVKEAVTSLLQTEQLQSPPSPVLTRRASIPPSQRLAISTHVREVEEEENQGRVPQTN